MMKLLLRYVVLVATIFLLSKYLNGFSITGVNSVKTILIVSLVLFFLYLIVKPIISLVTLPINVFTLGLCSLIINGLFVYVTAYYVAGFDIATFTTAIIASIIISVVNHIFGY
jgi:putative membrane protein